MKKTSYILCLVTITVLISSCSHSDKDVPIGQWGDIIKLSTKNIEFDANANSVTITTEGDWWWVIGVTVDDERFGVPDNVNIESDNYIIQQDCFTVERKDKNTLHIEIDENPSNAERIIEVGLEAGDYFDRVRITQSAR